MNEPKPMTTAAQEAIRIADTYLPGEPLERRRALAREIVDAINLCETELGEVIIRRIKAAERKS
jgi:hypothetical protein